MRQRQIVIVLVVLACFVGLQACGPAPPSPLPSPIPPPHPTTLPAETGISGDPSKPALPPEACAPAPSCGPDFPGVKLREELAVYGCRENEWNCTWSFWHTYKNNGSPIGLAQCLLLRIGDEPFYNGTVDCRFSNETQAAVGAFVADWTARNGPRRGLTRRKVLDGSVAEALQEDFTARFGNPSDYFAPPPLTWQQMRYYGGAVVTAADFGGATYLGTVSGDLLKFKGGALANLGDFGDIAYASASHQGRAYFGFGEGRLLSYNGTDFREEERQPEGLYALFPYGGALYAGFASGLVRRFDGRAWDNLTQLDSGVLVMTGFQDKLYLGSYKGFIYAYDGQAFTPVEEHESSVYVLDTFQNRLVAALHNGVVKLFDGQSWDNLSYQGSDLHYLSKAGEDFYIIQGDGEALRYHDGSFTRLRQPFIRRNDFSDITQRGLNQFEREWLTRFGWIWRPCAKYSEADLQQLCARIRERDPREWDLTDFLTRQYGYLAVDVVMEAKMRLYAAELMDVPFYDLEVIGEARSDEFTCSDFEQRVGLCGEVILVYEPKDFSSGSKAIRLRLSLDDVDAIRRQLLSAQTSQSGRASAAKRDVALWVWERLNRTTAFVTTGPRIIDYDTVANTTITACHLHRDTPHIVTLDLNTSEGPLLLDVEVDNPVGDCHSWRQEEEGGTRYALHPLNGTGSLNLSCQQEDDHLHFLMNKYYRFILRTFAPGTDLPMAGGAPDLAAAERLPHRAIKKTALCRYGADQFPVQAETRTHTGASVDIAMTVSRQGYSPSRLQVRNGDQVRLHLASDGGPYGFFLPELEAFAYLAPNQTTTIEFVAGAVDNYTFSCGVYCQEQGFALKGTLEVLPSQTPFEMGPARG